MPVQGGQINYGIMCCFLQGKIDSVGSDGKMDSEYYVNVLQNFLLPIVDVILIDGWFLQQGNASVHTSTGVKEVFSPMIYIS